MDFHCIVVENLSFVIRFLTLFWDYRILIFLCLCRYLLITKIQVTEKSFDSLLIPIRSLLSSLLRLSSFVVCLLHFLCRSRGTHRVTPSTTVALETPDIPFLFRRHCVLLHRVKTGNLVFLGKPKVNEISDDSILRPSVNDLLSTVNHILVRLEVKSS